MISRKPIDGNKNMYVDIEGYLLDEDFCKVDPQKDENGDLYNMVAGQKRLIKNLVYTHFANKGEGASIRDGEEPTFKDDNRENCAFSNLVIAKSKEDKTKEVLDNADTEGEEETQIIELFVEDPEATYDDISKRMKNRHDAKVSRNQIASAKKAWKKAVKEAGQA